MPQAVACVLQRLLFAKPNSGCFPVVILDADQARLSKPTQRPIFSKPVYSQLSERPIGNRNRSTATDRAKPVKPEGNSQLILSPHHREDQLEPRQWATDVAKARVAGAADSWLYVVQRVVALNPERIFLHASLLSNLSTSRETVPHI